MVSAGDRFDPRDFLVLAESLITEGATQAALRSAVSRAYYAVHLRARERLIERGRLRLTGAGEDHRLVIETLRAGGGPHGDQLNRLRAQRAAADYDLAASVTLGDARTSLSLAKHLYARL